MVKIKRRRFKGLNKFIRRTKGSFKKRKTRIRRAKNFKKKVEKVIMNTAETKFVAGTLSVGLNAYPAPYLQFYNGWYT